MDTKQRQKVSNIMKKHYGDSLRVCPDCGGIIIYTNEGMKHFIFKETFIEGNIDCIPF